MILKVPLVRVPGQLRPALQEGEIKDWEVVEKLWEHGFQVRLVGRR
jgi:actin-related protein